MGPGSLIDDNEDTDDNDDPTDDPDDPDANDGGGPAILDLLDANDNASAKESAKGSAKGFDLLDASDWDATSDKSSSSNSWLKDLELELDALDKASWFCLGGIINPEAIDDIDLDPDPDTDPFSDTKSDSLTESDPNFDLDDWEPETVAGLVASLIFSGGNASSSSLTESGIENEDKDETEDEFEDRIPAFFAVGGIKIGPEAEPEPEAVAAAAPANGLNIGAESTSYKNMYPFWAIISW